MFLNLLIIGVSTDCSSFVFAAALVCYGAILSILCLNLLRGSRFLVFCLLNCSLCSKYYKRSFSSLVFIGGAFDISVDECINGRSDGLAQSLKFALMVI